MQLFLRLTICAILVVASVRHGCAQTTTTTAESRWAAQISNLQDAYQAVHLPPEKIAKLRELDQSMIEAYNTKDAKFSAITAQRNAALTTEEKSKVREYLQSMKKTRVSANTSSSMTLQANSRSPEAPVRPKPAMTGVMAPGFTKSQEPSVPKSKP